MSARDDILAFLPALGIGEEFHYKTIGEMVGVHETTASGILSDLSREGVVGRVSHKRGTYYRQTPPPAPDFRVGASATFEVLKVRADGSRVVTDESGELYIITLVVI